ncbi:MAG TPA: alpha-hydroxy-acid oxidizing protein, partial [Burkholderiales bacterium]|nr:alpha-hydroxy-acid oxidizing protein [Burkholderiales bacterium]
MESTPLQPQPADRRSFLRNLSLFGAAGVPAALFAKKSRADAASAATNEPLLVAQTDKPKPKAAPAAPAENGDFKTLQEIVLTAKRNLKPELWTHLTGGSDSETTIRRNRMAYESLALRQRVLINVENVDIGTTFLGQKLEMPVFVCPVGGYTGQAHPQGIVAVVRGAEAAGTTAICASNVRPGFAAAAK